jgi:hypothetical protein
VDRASGPTCRLKSHVEAAIEFLNSGKTAADRVS